jgi:hypothetical protein
MDFSLSPDFLSVLDFHSPHKSAGAIQKGVEVAALIIRAALMALHTLTHGTVLYGENVKTALLIGSKQL